MSITTEDRRIEGPHGEVPVRIYRSGEGGAAYGLVWAHGGAFVGGDLDMPESDWVARQLARRGVVVVAVDYRLAPVPEVWLAAGGDDRLPPGPAERFHYPVASEEVASAFAWATTCDARIPAGDWAIGGASAGANLTAGAALRLRDAGGPLPRTLLLAYPVVHAELPPLPAELAAKVRALPPQSALGAEAVSMLNLNYVRDPEALKEPYAFPGGHDLSGLPPTFVVNSDRDSLRASGQKFGAELAAAGVDVVVIREDGTAHGHLNEPDNPAALRTVTRMADWLTSGSLLGVAHERED
ncbi:alpha/beta hydrolase [Paractinoplanes globisporus]|uniref:Alpha/beta hydrolase n=1 Tax=Paractinoplanes globisporus TaxID=113565 RepID=A0ABW6W9N1_9ACTN|nr:alpha/beta hydrolase fold domain-containing protein [Actinoplanes globisporus]